MLTDLSKLTENSVFQFDRPNSDPIFIELEADSDIVHTIEIVEKCVIYRFDVVRFQS